jgi:hypothetical protein
MGISGEANGKSGGYEVGLENRLMHRHMMWRS